MRSAIATWAPRFVAQGVDYNDFVRTTGRVTAWPEWLEAWCETGAMHAGLAREAEEWGRMITAGEAYVRAALCYHFAKFVWVLDMDRHRQATGKAVAALAAAHRLLDPTAERVEIPFEGRMLVGNLRRPADLARPPLVLLLPGLDSAKEEFFSWENVFLARGMATFSLDGPGQGETGYLMPIRHDYEVAVAAVLDALAARRDLDLRRVGAAGVSLGGYYAPRAAAFEPRIRAAAAIGGPFDWGALWDDLPALTREAFTAYSWAQDAQQARALARRLTLEGVLGRLRQPLLVVSGKLDRLIPWQHAERTAAQAPQAELVLYPEGNHVCNNVPYKYRPLVADWMRERLTDVG
ncbi:MAG: alpha/beta fold hydrolase [Armatimonadota bacterium]|nr:alpha/beta fold hydrolase [Armatimonadota bacterium]MDR7520544.1 alpha/beta fold hydrolase [Armatimonadota bacterium]